MNNFEALGIEPETLSSYFRVPLQLRTRDQWIARHAMTEGETVHHRSFIPGTGKHASPKDRSHWRSYEEANDFAREEGLDGVSFVLSPNDPFAVVRLLDVIQNDLDAMNPNVLDIIGSFDSFTEIADDGSVTIWIEASVRQGFQWGREVKIQTRNEFVALTRNHFLGTPMTIDDRTDVLFHFQQRLRDNGGPWW